MKSLSGIFLGFVMLISTQASADLLTYTIENIGRPYNVLEGTCVYQEARGFSFKTDPIESAIQGAFGQMEARAQELGADALIGFDIDFANRTQKDEGRVVLCGTLVKFSD